MDFLAILEEILRPYSSILEASSRTSCFYLSAIFFFVEPFGLPLFPGCFFGVWRSSSSTLFFEESLLRSSLESLLSSSLLSSIIAPESLLLSSLESSLAETSSSGLGAGFLPLRDFLGGLPLPFLGGSVLVDGALGVISLGS